MLVDCSEKCKNHSVGNFLVWVSDHGYLVQPSSRLGPAQHPSNCDVIHIAGRRLLVRSVCSSVIVYSYLAVSIKLAHGTRHPLTVTPKTGSNINPSLLVFLGGSEAAVLEVRRSGRIALPWERFTVRDDRRSSICLQPNSALARLERMGSAASQSYSAHRRSTEWPL